MKFQSYLVKMCCTYSVRVKCQFSELRRRAGWGDEPEQQASYSIVSPVYFGLLELVKLLSQDLSLAACKNFER